MRDGTLRGVLTHARWVKWESTETPTTSQLTSWNSLALSLNEMISVGHTKVLQFDKQRNKKHCEWNVYWPDHKITTIHLLHLDWRGDKHKAMRGHFYCPAVKVIKKNHWRPNIHWNQRKEKPTCCLLLFSCVSQILTNPEGRRRGPGICPWSQQGSSPWTPHCGQLWPWKQERAEWQQGPICKCLMQKSQTVYSFILLALWNQGKSSHHTKKL